MTLINIQHHNRTGCNFRGVRGQEVDNLFLLDRQKGLGSDPRLGDALGSKQTSRGSAHEADQPASSGTNCGGPTYQQYTKRRTIVTLEGVSGLRLKVRVCQTPSCPRSHKAYRPEAEGRYVLPQHAIGLDLIAQIGAWRYREHRSVRQAASSCRRWARTLRR